MRHPSLRPTPELQVLGIPDIEAHEIDTLANDKVDGLIVVPVASAESGPAVRAAAPVRPIVQFDR